MRNLWGAAVYAVIIAFVQPALADENTDQAKRLYESASRHFDLTEYDAALNDFKEGFRHKDDPVFLYNIAQCYRLLNKNDEALKFYRNYLRRDPTAANRVEVEHRIAVLQQARAAAAEVRQSPPQATPPPASNERGNEPPAHEVAASSETVPAAVVLTAAPPPRSSRRPVYKQWWLWTTVGVVVAAGVGIGLGIGLSQNSPRSLPGVTF